MDIFVKRFNQTIVSDGVLTNATYFDSDLDNYVFKVTNPEPNPNIIGP